MAKTERKLIGTIELANKLGIHPATVPRMRKTREGFPQPVFMFGKNFWEEEVIDHYIELLQEQHERQLEAVRRAEMKRKAAV
jgi:predicted DNA-binding transcriptional regulator AlpA